MNRFSPIGRTSSVALVMRLPCPYTVEPAGAAHPYLTVWTPLKVLKVSMALLGEVFGSVICICVPICEVWKVGEMEQNKVGTNSRTLHVSSTWFSMSDNFSREKCTKFKLGIGVNGFGHGHFGSGIQQDMVKIAYSHVGVVTIRTAAPCNHFNYKALAPASHIRFRVYNESFERFHKFVQESIRTTKSERPSRWVGVGHKLSPRTYLLMLP